MGQKSELTVHQWKSFKAIDEIKTLYGVKLKHSNCIRIACMSFCILVSNEDCEQET